MNITNDGGGMKHGKGGQPFILAKAGIPNTGPGMVVKALWGGVEHGTPH